MVIKLSEKQKITVMNSDDLYEVMRQILLRENKIDQDQEHFWVVCLNGLNKIINIELISLGSVDATIVKPMQVFRIAIQKGAVKVILVHNHPSGGLIPTHADRDLTDRMIQVGKIIHIEVCDHLIITLDGYYAFSKKGLLEEIRGSKKFVPLYKEQERIRKEALKIGKREGLREGKQIGLERGVKKGKKEGKKDGLKEGKKLGAKGKALEMAKAMKGEGEPLEKIFKFTGLSKEEIKKL
jgi:DNA repair protein RadC